MRALLLALIVVASAITAPAQARPWHWAGNTLVADGGWRWRILAHNWRRQARSFRPGFGSPVLVVRPSHSRPIGAYYVRRGGVWSEYVWRPYYSLDSLMNAKWCARYAARWWGIKRHAPKGC